MPDGEFIPIPPEDRIKVLEAENARLRLQNKLLEVQMMEMTLMSIRDQLPRAQHELAEMQKAVK